MEKFNHIVQSPEGIHARPAMMLMRQVKRYESKITVEYKGKIVNAKDLIALFSLRAGKGAEVTFILEGVDEKTAIVELQKFCIDNL